MSNSFDKVHWAPASITVEHNEIHEGKTFRGSVVNSSIASAGTLAICFKTPDSLEIHVIHELSISGKAHFAIIEGCTWTTGTGTAVNAFNMNRISSNTSSILSDSTGTFVAGGASKDPSSITGGTTVYTSYYFTDKKDNTTLRSDEIVLKNNTNYAFIVTSDQADTSAQIVLSWYEESQGPN